MNELPIFIQEHFNLNNLAKVSITIIIFIIALSFVKRIIKKYFSKKMSYETKLVFSKITKFVWFTLLIIVLADQLGFSSIFTTILGTAGIVGIAIGFASKTSLENIISGLLLLSDNSFKINDSILVDGIEGTVLAIDSLSVKILTYDNKLVRIPNVKILNSNLINLYPHQESRKDFHFKIKYSTNLTKLEEILKKIATENPYAIKTDETLIYFNEFQDIGIEVIFGVWFKKGDKVILTNSIIKQIAEIFQQENIEIPTQLLSLNNNS